MNKQRADELIFSYIRKIFGFAVSKLSRLDEAEELAAEITVQHYFHDKKVKEIAALLSLNENTVKWHLTCSRKELKTGMEKTRTTGTLGTEPIRFVNMGHYGETAGSRDTAYYLSKVITQNIAYAAYHQPRSVNEIAEELGVNPIFVEDEVAVLEEYGFMDKLKNGKYLTNILIYEPNAKRTEIYKEIDPKFSKLFAEKFFAPILEKITSIPDRLNVPDDDINLMKWSLMSFMAHKLIISDNNDLTRFYVKRPDGGNYIAFATLDVKSDNTVPNKYRCCGDMGRSNFSDGIWWKSWQLDHNWTGRHKLWHDNLTEDYDKMYFWLIGQPKHMHELIKCMNRSAAWSLQTRVMEHLLAMGVLKQPTEEQAKGLCTIMFMND